jgi:hypothetical protein
MEAAEMMLREQLLRVIEGLPPPRVAEVLDFALFIRQRHGSREAYAEHDEAGDAALLADAMVTLREYGDKPEAWTKWDAFKEELAKAEESGELRP